ncbi:MAG: peroxiredoxin [Gammaproteobacteria bacterium HGW-Gammaproteobacteria-11]|nr:MAG: peroxiredoxin [Gammaproteobacteria bacterium HGW-Gammaproteobacteria-11]
MSEGSVNLRLEQQQGYRFTAVFDSDTPDLITDEPAPLGQSAGPSPAELLVTAVANCLTDSLIFALNKFKQPSNGMRTEAVGEIGRNQANRLRVLKVSVTITLGQTADQIERLERILGQFEQFCTVSQSVAQCLPIHLRVLDSNAAVLKESVLEA